MNGGYIPIGGVLKGGDGDDNVSEHSSVAGGKKGRYGLYGGGSNDLLIITTVILILVLLLFVYSAYKSWSSANVELAAANLAVVPYLWPWTVDPNAPKTVPATAAAPAATNTTSSFRARKYKQ